jgi:hypothetical protein
VRFHALHIVINDAFIEAEKPEQIGQELVPMRNLAGRRFPSGSQNETAIFFTVKVSEMKRLGKG